MIVEEHDIEFKPKRKNTCAVRHRIVKGHAKKFVHLW
jgi:hypothetical protein